ncbi:MAG: hypothetical protein JNM45_13325 [Rhizobiales bacterium]|nr:hypothetical protein [Hyphomicrobiales bacterium]
MSSKHKHREGEMEFRLLLAVTLPFFFAATVFKRVMPWNWGRDKRSVFAATRTAAHNSLPFAFM